MSQTAEAERLYGAFLTVNRKQPPNEENIRILLTGLGEVRVAQHRGADAELIAREAFKLAEEDPQELPRTQAVLGAALRERGKFAEAEPLLLSSYKAITGDATASPRSKARALQAPR